MYFSTNPNLLFYISVFEKFGLELDSRVRTTKNDHRRIYSQGFYWQGMVSGTALRSSHCIVPVVLVAAGSPRGAEVATDARAGAAAAHSRRAATAAAYPPAAAAARVEEGRGEAAQPEGAG